MKSNPWRVSPEADKQINGASESMVRVGITPEDVVGSITKALYMERESMKHLGVYLTTEEIRKYMCFKWVRWFLPWGLIRKHIKAKATLKAVEHGKSD